MQYQSKLEITFYLEVQMNYPLIYWKLLKNTLLDEISPATEIKANFLQCIRSRQYVVFIVDHDGINYGMQFSHVLLITETIFCLQIFKELNLGKIANLFIWKLIRIKP